MYVRTDTRTVHSVEMQTSDSGDFLRSARFDHAMCDVNEFEKGVRNYNKLPDVFVMFICTFDIFGAGRYIYTIRDMRAEDRSSNINDGAASAENDSDMSGGLHVTVRATAGLY